VKVSKKLLYVVAGGAGVLALQLAFHLAGPTAFASSHEEHPTEHPTEGGGAAHLVVAPFADGTGEAWLAFLTEFTADTEGAVEFNKRHNLTRQAGWIAQTPGGPVAVVIHEGPGAADLMMAMGASDHEYDVALVAKLEELHGIDFSAPPPGPPPTLCFASNLEGIWGAAPEHPTEHPE